MRYDFSAATDAQLAELFPIILAGHNPAWAGLYEREAAAITRLFGPDNIVRLSHIGSTAVKGLIAKPTIDILAEVKPDTDIPALAETMLDEGYVVNNPPGDIIMFLKGYTPRSFQGQAFHIHVRQPGDWGAPYFRDYLNLHPKIAARYGKLKLLLETKYKNDRDAYTVAKSEFVQIYTNIARQEFANRYRTVL